MKTPFRFTILAAFAIAIGVGGLTGLLLVTRGTTTSESATEILQKSAVTQLQVLAALGPNTTYHTVTTEHKEQSPSVANTSGFASPDATTTELFMTFDSAGMLAVFTQVTRGADGQIYSRGQWDTDHIVFTDAKTGAREELPYGRFPATAIRDRISQATTKAVTALGPAATAKSAMIDGAAAFVIEASSNRTYIDKNDYRLLRSERLAPDGHVVSYSMPTVFEVLPASASTATPSAIASVTPTASATMAAPTPTP